MSRAEGVIIGVDPHKMSVTIEVVDHQETLLGSGRFNSDKADASTVRGEPHSAA